MPGTTLFISDLHLCGVRPAITGLFLDFLRRRARGTDALYILGDLFEYWIGDEAVEQEEFRSIIRGLRELTAGGTPVFVMHGNRDFLMSDVFEKATGGRLLKDPAHIDLYGTPTLLMHGDSLCTDDTEYMTSAPRCGVLRGRRNSSTSPSRSATGSCATSGKSVKIPPQPRNRKSWT